MFDNFVSEPVAQTLWTIAVVLAFAGLGAIYAYSGKAKNNDESFDWARGKYPVIALGGAGAVAGVITLLTSGEFDILVFGAALSVVGVVLDQIREMWQAGSEEYDELRDEGVDEIDAATQSFLRALEEGDIKTVEEAINSFTSQHGQPDPARASERGEEARETYRDEGVSGLYPDEEAALQVDDEVLEGRAHTADAAPTESEPAPDKGEHYVGDGDVEDEPEQEEDTDAGGLPPA